MQDIADSAKSRKSKWSGHGLTSTTGSVAYALVDICTSSGHVMSKMAKNELAVG